MRLRFLWKLVTQSIRRHPRDFFYSSLGLVISIGLLSFCIALGTGVAANVIDRVFPTDIIEVEKGVAIIAANPEERDGPKGFDEAELSTISKIEGVERVFPKQPAIFKARLWGGAALMGKDIQSEAFFDGISPNLVEDDLLQASENLGNSSVKERPLPCMSERECPGGRECQNGKCAPAPLGKGFEDYEAFFSCDSNDHCIDGMSCLAGRCEKACVFAQDTCGDGHRCTLVACQEASECGAGNCVDGFCETGRCLETCQGSPDGEIPERGTCERERACSNISCRTAADCGSGTCDNGICREDYACLPIACAVDSPADIAVDSAIKGRGKRLDWCEDGSRKPKDGPCEYPLMCPSGTYCSTSYSTEVTGYCQRPVPVLLNPIGIEVFTESNMAAGDTVGLSEDNALLGLRFRVELGASNVAKSSGLPREQRRTVQCVVAAMSSVPGIFGGTIPLHLVRGFNARYARSREGETYRSAILKVSGGSRLQGVLNDLKEIGAQPTADSESVHKAGALVFWVTVAFGLLALVVLWLTGMNIGHTMLMIIHDRQRDFGVFRCLGATRSDLRNAILGEAVVLGVFGSTVGLLMALLGATIGDYFVLAHFVDVPLLPDTFFKFEPIVSLVGVGIGILFSLVGAWIPSRKAMNVDPANLVRGG